MIFDIIKGDFVVHDGKLTECDGVDALKVWIGKVLHTEKSRFEIYPDTEFGCKLEDLIVGSNYSSAFIESELKREVSEALLSNPSITAITNFKLERSYTTLIVSLEVKTDDEIDIYTHLDNAYKNINTDRLNEYVSQSNVNQNSKNGDYEEKEKTVKAQ